MTTRLSLTVPSAVAVLVNMTAKARDAQFSALADRSLVPDGALSPRRRQHGPRAGADGRMRAGADQRSHRDRGRGGAGTAVAR